MGPIGSRQSHSLRSTSRIFNREQRAASPTWPMVFLIGFRNFAPARIAPKCCSGTIPIIQAKAEHREINLAGVA